MFVYQNGKLYVQKDKGIVGVEIYSDKTLIVEGTEIEFDRKIPYQMMTTVEAKARLNITKDKPFLFKKEVKEVVDSDPVGKTKNTTKKPKRVRRTS